MTASGSDAAQLPGGDTEQLLPKKTQGATFKIGGLMKDTMKLHHGKLSMQHFWGILHFVAMCLFGLLLYFYSDLLGALVTKDLMCQS